MARILVVGVESVLSAALEDRLLPDGHQLELVPDGARAVSLAVEQPVDLVIVAMALAPSSGLAVVRALRSHAETRGVPILILSDRAADRVSALREGADDSLTLPCDLDELVLRIERFLGVRGRELAVLQGDLTGHPLWEVLQNAEQSGKSGFLDVAGRTSSGRLELRNGRVVSARWQRLRGSEACLAVLGLKEGRFRLAATRERTDEEDRGTERAASIQSLLLEASRLEDELERRSRFLPGTGVPLEPVADHSPPTDGRPLGPPGTELVYQRIRKRPGTRLFDLLETVDLAPLRIRLALAVLLEEGYVAPCEDGETSPSTTRLAFSALLRVATLDLLDAAGMTAEEPGVLPVLLAADRTGLPRLCEILSAAPAASEDLAGCRRLAERLAAGRGGSAVLGTELGRLSLHAHPAEPQASGRIGAILAACGAVLLWIGDAATLDALDGVEGWVDHLRPPATAIMVADGDETLQAAHDRLGQGVGWRITRHPPHSLLGVLRLLHPGPGG